MRFLSEEDIQHLRDTARALPGICRDQHGGKACDDCTEMSNKALAILDRVAQSQKAEPAHA